MPNETQTEPDLWEIPVPTPRDHCAQCAKPAPEYCSWFFEASFCSQECYDAMMKYFEANGGEPEDEPEDDWDDWDA